jgi:hypothetical protein
VQYVIWFANVISLLSIVTAAAHPQTANQMVQLNLVTLNVSSGIIHLIRFFLFTGSAPLNMGQYWVVLVYSATVRAESKPETSIASSISSCDSASRPRCFTFCHVKDAMITYCTRILFPNKFLGLRPVRLCPCPVHITNQQPRPRFWKAWF